MNLTQLLMNQLMSRNPMMYQEFEKMEEKYMQVSHTLFDMFMTEHNNIGNIFKEQ